MSNQEQGKDLIRHRLRISDLGQLPVEAALYDFLKEHQTENQPLPTVKEAQTEDGQA